MDAWGRDVQGVMLHEALSRFDFFHTGLLRLSR